MSLNCETFLTEGSLSSSYDVIIVGAGIAGVMTGYFLSQEGLSVAIFDKGLVAAEQSSRNWGFIRQIGRQRAEMPIMKLATELWGHIQRDLDIDLGFRRSGTIYLTEMDKVPEKWREILDGSLAHGIESAIISGAEAQWRVPSPRKWTAGLYTPSDAYAEPWRAIPRVAKAMAAKGVSIFQQCAVLELEMSGGKVTGVLTESGPVRADVVVCAAGFWSSLLLRAHGIRLPQLAVKASVQRTTAAPWISDVGGIGSDKFTMRRRDDGGWNIARPLGWTVEIVPDSFRFFWDFRNSFAEEISHLKFRFGRPFFRAAFGDRKSGTGNQSPFPNNRILDAEPDQAVLFEAMNSVRQTFPRWKELTVASSWAGMIDTTPDSTPVVGPVPDVAGLFVATGFSGHGFGMGPGAGKLLSDLIRKAAPVTDPTPFRFDRFK